MRKRTFFHCCDQNAKMQLNWYLRYLTIDYDRLSKSRATADRRGSKSLSEQQGLRCTNESSWKTNHSRASCFIRSHITSRPYRLKKTSSMQSKRGDLHHTWLHRETNDKVIFYFYCLKSVSRLLIISLDLNTGKSKRIPKGGYFCSLPNLGV